MTYKELAVALLLLCFWAWAGCRSFQWVHDCQTFEYQQGRMFEALVLADRLTRGKIG